MMKLLPSKIENTKNHLIKALEEENAPIIFSFPAEYEEDVRRIAELIAAYFERVGKKTVLLDEEFAIPLTTDAEVLIVFRFLRIPEIKNFIEARNIRKVLLLEKEDLLAYTLFAYKVLHLEAESQQREIFEQKYEICNLAVFFSGFEILIPFTLAARLLGKNEDELGLEIDSLASKGVLKIVESLYPAGLLLFCEARAYKPLNLSLKKIIHTFDPKEELERHFMSHLFTTFFEKPTLKEFLLSRGNWAELRKGLNDVLEKVSPYLDKPWEFLMWANTLKEARLLQEACKLLDECVQKFRNFEPAFFFMAEIFGERSIGEKKYAEEMRKTFQRLLREKQDNFYVYLRWARIETRLRNFRLAHELLETARKLSGNPSVYALQIDCALEGLYFKRAKVLLAEALSLFPENMFLLHLNARFHIMEGTLDKAFSVLEKLKKTYPDNAYVASTQAEALMAADRHEEALNLIEGSLRRFPGHPVLRHQLARVSLETGDVQRAVKILEDLKDYDPLEPRIWLELSRAYYYAKRYSESLHIAEEGLKRFVHNIPFRHRKAEALIAIKKYDKAAKELEEILKEEPLNPFALCSYARLKFLLGEDAKYYLEVLEEALKQKKIDFLRQKRLEECLEHLKRWRAG